MREKGTDVTTKYNIEVKKAGRARGAMLLTTESGPLLLKECPRTEQRLEFEQQIHRAIAASDCLCSDVMIENAEGKLLTLDGEQKPYIIKKWYYGEECNPTEREDVCAAAQCLGKLHTLMYGKIPVNDRLLGGNLIVCYERYNREMQRARNFVRNKRHKTDFELQLLRGFDTFFESCLHTLDLLKQSEYPSMYREALKQGELIHGDYNYHNIIFTSQREKAAIVNFESACVNLRIIDICNFLRKVMEKNDWDEDLGLEILQSYDRERKITAKERNLLKILLMYPEKFRKVVNHYFNGNKSWIPVKSMEKLILVHKQMELREKFVQFL